MSTGTQVPGLGRVLRLLLWGPASRKHPSTVRQNTDDIHPPLNCKLILFSLRTCVLISNKGFPSLTLIIKVHGSVLVERQRIVPQCGEHRTGYPMRGRERVHSSSRGHGDRVWRTHSLGNISQNVRRSLRRRPRTYRTPTPHRLSALH